MEIDVDEVKVLALVHVHVRHQLHEVNSSENIRKMESLQSSLQHLDKRQKTSKYDHHHNGDDRRRHRRDRSASKSNSDRSDRHHSPEQSNG